ncbi:trypsin-like serine peptidase [Caulobacter sp. KR2-114]|uniref:trypsin-like serine peptidase n=1 Tax=Caulobacter sp. KR2-114 TaxID=3400912 RepID=UPI003C073BD2
MLRTQVSDLSAWPHAGICLIQGRFRERPQVIYGTGFLVSPTHIATAAHLFTINLDGPGGHAVAPDLVDVILGQGFFDDATHLSWTFDFASPQVTVHPDWAGGDQAHDIARIVLPSAQPRALPLAPSPAALAVGGALTLSGYPIDAEPFGAWEGTGALRDLASPVFHHAIDTGAGDSGAPVRVQIGGQWTVIGAHLGEAGLDDAGQPLRRALAMTQPLIDWLTT